MKNFFGVFVLLFILTSCDGNVEEENYVDRFKGMYQIPSSEGKSVKYYLKKYIKNGEYYISEHARVSSSSTGYSRTKIDCKNAKYMDLAYSSVSFSDLDNNIYSNTSWTNLVDGSSKSNLVDSVCNILNKL